tara:strand:- start:793 stop:1221 length:429 start_codon:yes stop_codon:yes gene_type:complete
MKFNIYTVLIILKLFFYSFFINSEPFVVLEYATSKSDSNNREKTFNNENFSTYHVVKQNETLSKIMYKYYGNKGLNFTFVQAAILQKNKNSFVRSNPNFLYARKKLYLPSVNEIKDLVYKKNKTHSVSSKNSNEQQIYFFGR